MPFYMFWKMEIMKATHNDIISECFTHEMDS